MTGWGRPVMVKGPDWRKPQIAVWPNLLQRREIMCLRLHRIGRCQPRLRPGLVALLLLVVGALALPPRKFCVKFLRHRRSQIQKNYISKILDRCERLHFVDRATINVSVYFTLVTSLTAPSLRWPVSEMQFIRSAVS
jgi:hypothetical protein